MSSSQTQQEPPKLFDKKCYGCQQPVKMRRNDNDTGWLFFGTDGISVHNCQGKNKNTTNSKMLAELVEIKELQKTHNKLMLELMEILRQQHKVIGSVKG